MGKVIPFKRKVKNNIINNKFDLFVDIDFYDHEVKSLYKMYSYFIEKYDYNNINYDIYFMSAMQKTFKCILDGAEYNRDQYTITINACEIFYFDEKLKNTFNFQNIFDKTDLSIFKDIIMRLKFISNPYLNLIYDFQKNPEVKKINIMENIWKNAN